MEREKRCICSEKLTRNYLSGKTHTLRVMPQAVEAYVNGKNFQTINYIKRQLLNSMKLILEKLMRQVNYLRFFSLNYAQHNTY